MRLPPLSRARVFRAPVIWLLAWSGLASCNGGVCKPNEEESCACPGGGKGTQRCEADGSRLSSCDCSDATSTGEAAEIERRVGAIESAQRTRLDQLERLSRSVERIDAQEKQNRLKRGLRPCRCKPADPLCDCL